MADSHGHQHGQADAAMTSDEGVRALKISLVGLLATAAFQGVIAEQRAGGNRGHASMQAVETKRAVHEIGGAFARAADTTELDDVLRQYAHFVHRCDDLV